MSTYLIKTVNDERTVLRIDGENDTHYTVTSPLFVRFGSTFSHFGRSRAISKKWVNSRKFAKMDPTMAAKYDQVKRFDDSSVLFD